MAEREGGTNTLILIGIYTQRKGRDWRFAYPILSVETKLKK